MQAGFTISRKGREEAKAFWSAMPLVQKEYYIHERKTLGKIKGWEMLFDELYLESDTDLELYCDTRSQGRNRYKDVVPYFHARVKLNDPKNDYINASLVKMEEVRKSYIIAQGPMANTVIHFWQMVWEQKSVGIVMLCQCKEDEEELSAPYWPLEGQSPIVAGSYVVECTSADWKEHYCISSLKLCNMETDETRTILHFHYYSWPDIDVPEDPFSFLEFLMEVRNSGVMMQPDSGPAVVHCSAGVGHSGVFAVSDACLSLLEKPKGFKSLDVNSVILKMREQRSGLIETIEQLQFTYLVILNGAHYLEIAPSIAALERRIANFNKALVKREVKRSKRKRAAASTSQQPPEQCLPQTTPSSTTQHLSSKSTPLKTPTPCTTITLVATTTPPALNSSNPPPTPCSSSTASLDTTAHSELPAPSATATDSVADTNPTQSSPPETPSVVSTLVTSPVSTRPSAPTLTLPAMVHDLTSTSLGPIDIEVASNVPEQAETASVDVKKDTKQKRRKRGWFKKLKKTFFRCTRGASE